MYDAIAESMPEGQRRELQQQRLRAVVTRLLLPDGLQGQRLKDAGITSGDDVSLDDLHWLPSTSKRDLWDAYPFGFLAVPREEVVAGQCSRCTGGRPTLVRYTRRAPALWGEMVARSLGCAGLGAGDVVHNAYGYGLFTGGMGFHL